MKNPNGTLEGKVSQLSDGSWEVTLRLQTQGKTSIQVLPTKFPSQEVARHALDEVIKHMVNVLEQSGGEVLSVAEERITLH